jgi:2-oxoglutarate ferredoxin oxidoreductase subunit delta
MAKQKGAVVIDTVKCKGCGLCVEACPTKTLGLAKEINAKGFNYAEMVKDECIACVSCALVCPDAVITVYKLKKEKAV